jgi:hypothetical protein
MHRTVSSSRAALVISAEEVAIVEEVVELEPVMMDVMQVWNRRVSWSIVPLLKNECLCLYSSRLPQFYFCFFAATERSMRD